MHCALNHTYSPYKQKVSFPSVISYEHNNCLLKTEKKILNKWYRIKKLSRVEKHFQIRIVPIFIMHTYYSFANAKLLNRPIAWNSVFENLNGLIWCRKWESELDLARWYIYFRPMSDNRSDHSDVLIRNVADNFPLRVCVCVWNIWWANKTMAKTRRQLSAERLKNTESFQFVHRSPHLYRA